MVGDGHVEKRPKDKKKKTKKKRGGGKKKMTAEQSLAFNSVTEWVYLDQSHSSSSSEDDFGVHQILNRAVDNNVVFELHSHSNFSDGYLSPSKLVERAHCNGVEEALTGEQPSSYIFGLSSEDYTVHIIALLICLLFHILTSRTGNVKLLVKVLALTDHDTMSGIPEAIETARRFGIKIIPGVEISTIFSQRGSESEEPVHILAYYSSCGPSKYEELENFLANIRDGRFLRAKDMILKLNKLKLPLKWEHVAKIAGKGVAPGRLHVARAMVEAGHVENLKHAFADISMMGDMHTPRNEPVGAVEK
ncbi:hypothetical protein CUMW_255700 [Citrus unshiu]|uniref:Polymerase/histidinol phosphatase N-terminal domain-containing protein n=1 Tax=Citrus unshiu TaxID=55188 RepID=A0A2H5QRU4_CITUN|nr:hypothetical protein CUMW_255700 [Citrus unshiu]